MRLLPIILFLSVQSNAQPFLLIGKTPVKSVAPPVTYLDSAQFAFSLSQDVAGYTMLKGNPNLAVFSATGSYGISVTSVATNKWTSGLSGGSDNGGQTGAISNKYWFGQLPVGTIADSNMVVYGLVPGAGYALGFFASRDASAVGAAQRYCSYIIRDANGDTTILDYNIKGNVNTFVSGGVRTADANGRIQIRCNPRSPTDAIHNFAYIGILTVKRYPR
jgi:hypothetical protein